MHVRIALDNSSAGLESRYRVLKDWKGKSRELSHIWANIQPELLHQISCQKVVNTAILAGKPLHCITIFGSPQTTRDSECCSDKRKATQRQDTQYVNRVTIGTQQPSFYS